MPCSVTHCWGGVDYLLIISVEMEMLDCYSVLRWRCLIVTQCWDGDAWLLLSVEMVMPDCYSVLRWRCLIAVLLKCNYCLTPPLGHTSTSHSEKLICNLSNIQVVSIVQGDSITYNCSQNFLVKFSDSFRVSQSFYQPLCSNKDQEFSTGFSNSISNSDYRVTSNSQSKPAF